MMEQLMRKVAVKMEEELYQKLADEAKKQDVTVSEHIRQILRSSTLYSNPNLVEAVCGLSFYIHNIRNKYALEESDVEKIDGRVRRIWQQLR